MAKEEEIHIVFVNARSAWALSRKRPKMALVAFVRSVSETGCGFAGIRNRGTSMKKKVPDWFVKKIIIINSQDSKAPSKAHENH